MPGAPGPGPSGGCCFTKSSISPGRGAPTVPRASGIRPRRASPPRSHQRGEWIQRWAWRQAWRSLSRRPAFFAATVLTLAFGAGITTAVFSLVDTVLIKPLPYPDADALVTVYELSPSARERRSLVAPGRLQDWHRANRSFVAISATNTESLTDTSGEEPERLAGVRVSPRFFEVYAQPPIAGRWFYRGRGAGYRPERGGDQRAFLDEALQSRSFGDWPGADHRRQGISDRRRDAGIVHRRDDRRLVAGEKSTRGCWGNGKRAS